MRERVVSVSQLVRYLKSKLDSDNLIQKIQIEGEISNFTAHRSGHWYFSLKDDHARISCVMFQTYARSLRFLPKDGDKVTVTANTSLFESAGQLQLYCTSMKPTGLGDLYVQLELLKKKLRNEGLFDLEHKKSLPEFPMRIGVIVGANTAAREDIMTTIQRRWPVAEVLEFHSLVQGETAHLELIAALARADQSNCDVLILARGGGSIEDLWAFNNEHLAHYLYQMNTPVVTGIGHEVDTTICDYVADVRAATPTAAAELVTPDLKEVLVKLHSQQQKMTHLIQSKLSESVLMLDSLSGRKVLSDPNMFVEAKRLKLDHSTSLLRHQMESRLHDMAKMKNRMIQCSSFMNQILQNQKQHLVVQSDKMQHFIQYSVQSEQVNLKNRIVQLDAYSPLKILARGYSIATLNDKPILSIQQVDVDDQLELRVSDGTLKCTVTDKGDFS